MIALVFVLGCPTLARADNTTLANAYSSIIGHRHVDVLEPTGTPGDIGYFAYNLTAGRSYSAFCLQPSIDAGGGCVIDIRNNSDVSINVGVNTEPFPDFGDLDAAVISTSGTYYVRITNTLSVPAATYVVLIETTLFSPWYFVQSASAYDGYVTIRNNTPAPLSVTLTAYTNTGSLAGTTTVSIPGNGNTFIPIGSTFGITSGSGSAAIVHNGPVAAIAANITTLSPTTGLSFDAPFTPRMGLAVF
ncbi:MAG: hypothetical protein ACREUU_11400 [Gammaproteobacteria bacterium]